MAPDGPATELAAPTRRLHPSSLLFDAGRHLLSFFSWGLAALFFAARSGEGWFLLFLLLPLGEALFRYFTFRYALEGDRLVIREGAFVRNVRHVPYARIQNIDTLQGPLHRLLGVVEVRLETAAGSEPEAVFRVISSAQLTELRTGVFGAAARPSSADEAFVLAAPEGEAAFFRMRNADVLLFGLLSQRALALAAGAIVALREFISEYEVEERLGFELEEASESASSLGPWGWALVIAIVFVLLQAGSVLWAFLTLYGFRIERKGEDLRTTCGLFTRQTASLPRARVQYLGVRQSGLQRLLARVSVRASSAGGDSTQESQVSRKWLVPLCRRADLAAVLAEVQPEASFDSVAWRSVHPRAVRRLFLRWVLVLVPASVPAWWSSPLAGSLASLAALAAALVLARLRARILAWGLGSRAVFLRDGLLGRRLACVRFEKIQSIALIRTPFDRRARMAALSIDTAGAASVGQRFVVPFLGLREAGELAQTLRREAAAVRFRW